MNREALFAMVALLITAFLVLIAMAVMGAPTKEQRERERYERQYPCINGIRYIRSGYDAGASLTPMIDPATMQPQLCGPEVVR